MAPKPIQLRTWCKTCNDWTFHNMDRWDEIVKDCKECDARFTDFDLKDIPSDKLQEQQQRYSVYVKEEARKSRSQFMSLLSGNGLNEMLFNASMEEVYRMQTVEDDAGMRVIYDERRKERERQREIKKQEQLELVKTARLYQALGRNDKCLCGSGNKYKKCCQNKYENI